MDNERFFSEDEKVGVGSCLRLLAALFYSTPDSPALAPFFSMVRNGVLAEEWPFGNEDVLAGIQKKILDGLDIASLKEAHQRLFIGPDSFEAPAWGSVYLDRESVLFGESTLELRTFLGHTGAQLETGINEPEDHIGLMLWLASDFITADKDEEFRELLQQHLLPWSGRYLELLDLHAGQAFYAGLARLTELTLAGIAAKAKLVPAVRKLYR